MYWLLTDETNVDPAQGAFFIYGGLVMNDEQLCQLHQQVKEIRANRGYRPGDSLKFQLAARPEHVTQEQARLAKQEVLQAAERVGVRLIVNVILHAIAGTDTRRKMQFAMNTVLFNYYWLLGIEAATGVVSIDRVDEAYGYAYLKEVFQRGLTFQSGAGGQLDDRIVHYGMSSDNASHISSVVDIALGGFRYCVNTAGGKGRTEIAGDTFPTLARLMWSQEVDGRKHIGGYGYIERSRTVKVAQYEAQYTELRAALVAFSQADTTAPKNAPGEMRD